MSTDLTSKFDTSDDSQPQYGLDNSVKGVRLADVEISSGAAQWLSDHMRMLETRVIREAFDIAKANQRTMVAPMDISNAAQRFMPNERPITHEAGFRSRVLQSISGITLIAAILAVIFGLLAAYGGKELANGAWDIAKIFAGAIVGSTGAAAANKKH